jgi:hypothetical protein
MIWLILLLLSLSESKHIHPYNVDRIIVLANVKNYSSSVPTIYDFDHTSFRALGLYDNSYIDNWDVLTKNHMLAQFGLNFNAGVPGILPGTIELKNSSTGVTYATMIPYKYIVNNTYRIQLDTENVERGESGDWFNNAFGNLVLMAGSGTYPGGLAQGTIYYDGDILSYVFYQFMKEGSDISKEKNREQIKLRSEYAARQVPNSFGILQPFINDKAYDKYGNPGGATVGTHSNLNYLTRAGKSTTLSIISFPEWNFT